MSAEKCPICKKPMSWQEGLLHDGARNYSTGRYFCIPCRISGKMKDSRELRKGRKLAKNFKGISALDKRITRLSTAMQLGILRGRQREEGE